MIKLTKLEAIKRRHHINNVDSENYAESQPSLDIGSLITEVEDLEQINSNLTKQKSELIRDYKWAVENLYKASNKLQIAQEALEKTISQDRTRGYPTGFEWMKIIELVRKALKEIQK